MNQSIQERNFLVRKLGSPQKARKKNQNQDGKFDWKRR